MGEKPVAKYIRTYNKSILTNPWGKKPSPRIKKNKTPGQGITLLTTKRDFSIFQKHKNSNKYIVANLKGDSKYTTLREIDSRVL